MNLTGKTIRVRGTVQGVGFRPTVWRLAREFGLVGEVWNDGAGVTIRAWGPNSALDEFIRQIPLQAPPLARIIDIDSSGLDSPADTDEFRIVASRSGEAHTNVAADAATCPACLSEVLDPSDRRYRYPFSNCTHCGPRLSIIRGIPYDRANTSMASFEMCPACRAEYENPADRRFHAQPNACPVCGPKLWLEDGNGAPCAEQNGSDAIGMTAELIRQGYIVAIKGLGGFHLACDASNQQSVALLRSRKLRYAKPFAIMARDIAMLEGYVELTPPERAALSDPAAPIVILAKQGKPLADAVAPGEDKLGCMLPYTPLHHILMQALDTPIVLTSGNRSDEPQCISNDDARQRLAGIADYWLLHDRDIVNRLDDSVMRVMAGQPRLLRRARGYAPQPLALPPGFEQAPLILAMGGELKNTFCLLKDGQAILSPHIGDLENALVQQDYRRMLALYQELFDFKPELITVDLHADYLSTQLGRQWAEQYALPLTGVQHHHAHIAACMAEHDLPIDTGPVLGVAMDGLGLGDDGMLWGGEFLIVDYRQSVRLAAFQPLPLLGGAQAMHQPWRNSYAHLKSYFDWQTLSERYADLDIIRFLSDQPLSVLDAMLEKNLNSPPSSSCGRWFDAFAAALGICRDSVNYEGQAAIGLETLAAPAFEAQRGQGYRYDWSPEAELPLLSWRPFWQGVLDDLQRGKALPVIAARIHHGLAVAIAETSLHIADGMGSETVALSGGVFQNRLLLEEVSRLLRAGGKQVLSPAKLPCNDGGLALGQAMIASALRNKPV
ncbi:MAG: carbamoyltransferase HypF [Methylococcaceae bacterium]|nr:carbamoyltransferase HypF [Methylococcaceae bacterium]